MKHEDQYPTGNSQLEYSLTVERFGNQSIYIPISFGKSRPMKYVRSLHCSVENGAKELSATCQWRGEETVQIIYLGSVIRKSICHSRCVRCGQVKDMLSQIRHIKREAMSLLFCRCLVRKQKHLQEEMQQKGVNHAFPAREQQ